MNRSAPHIIHTINASVHCNMDGLQKVNDAQINELIKSAIEEMEAEFDQFSGDQYYKFQQISLDIELTEKQIPFLKEEIKKALNKCIIELKNEEEIKDELGKKGIAKVMSPVQILIHFLKTGTLPWQAKEVTIDPEKMEVDDVKSEVIAPLVLEMKYNTLAIKRLVNQFTQREVLNLLKILTTNQFARSVEKLIEELKVSSKQYSKVFDIDFRLATIVLESVFRTLVHSEKSGKQIELQWTSIWNQIIPKIHKKYPILNSIILDTAVENTKIQLITSSFQEYKKKSGQSDGIVSSTEVDEHDEMEFYHQKEKLSKPESKKYYTKKAPTPKEMIHVKNAGIILLHPFLNSFFKKVGLVNKGEFISEECQQRAVCLLHYIATGELEFDEQNLYFQKIICNYPIEESIPKDLPISPFEIDEVDALLNAVLAHWTSLKGTTAKGLRGNFLVRSGVLQYENEEPIIHIENKTADILLKNIPWTLNYVKWPWHSQLLTIKWS